MYFKPAATCGSVAFACLLLLQLASGPIKCQGISEDEYESAQHQDIGRITKGSASNVAPVAAPVNQLVQAAPQLLSPVHVHQHQPLTRQQHVVVDKTVPIVTSDPLGATVAQAARYQYTGESRKPSSGRVQLTARPSPQLVHQSSLPLEQLYAAVPAPVQHTAAPVVVTQPPVKHKIELVTQSPPPFHSTEGSVTEHHDALIAQIANERGQSSSSLIDVEPASASLAAPVQVQPPPTLRAAAASPIAAFVNQPVEPLVAPSFEQILGQGCPQVGVFSYENRDHCDRYYLCTNGTFTEEACPNGLGYSQMGAVYQHCAYNWNVNCGTKKAPGPIASPGCPWQFGIFPIEQNGRCSIDYFVCEWGVPETRRCTPEGLFYDDRIKGCQWADQLGCKSESLLNFKCPPEDENNPYWPYPRYYYNPKDIVVCVNEQPRLVHCTDEQAVDPGSLACIDLKKKKKKF